MPRSRLLDRFALAKAEGVTVATVDRWVNEGLPVARRGVRGHVKTLLDRDVARRWRRAAKAGHRDPGTLRLLAAATALVEAEMDKLRREWVPVATAARLGQALVDVLEPILRAWPAAATAALAPALAAGLSGAALAYRSLEGVVRDVQVAIAAGAAMPPAALVSRAGLVIEPPVGRAPEPPTTREAKARLLDARGALAELRLELRRGTWRRQEDWASEQADRHARALQVFSTLVPGRVATSHVRDSATLRRIFDEAVAAALHILRGDPHDDPTASPETSPSSHRRRRAPRAHPPRVDAHARGAPATPREGR